MEFTFSGLFSSVPRFLKQRADDLDLEERRDMAREFLRVSFEHLASRVVLGLNEMQAEDNDKFGQLKDLVVSGGVASNGYLRHLSVKDYYPYIVGFRPKLITLGSDRFWISVGTHIFNLCSPLRACARTTRR